MGVGLCLALCLLHAEPLAAEADQQIDQQCLGPVRKVKVVKCTGTFCDDTASLELLLETLGLKPGRSVDPSEIDAGMKQLTGLRLMKRVIVRCKRGAGGLEASVSFVGMPRIAKIVLQGNRSLSDRALLRLMGILPQDPLDPDDPSTADVLDRIRTEVLAAYMDKGIQGTQVAVGVTKIGSTEVEVTVRIREGHKTRLGQVHAVLRGPATSRLGRSGTARWHCPHISEERLLDWAGVSKGDNYTELVASQAVRRLERKLRETGFAGIRVVPRFDPRKHRLELEATYERCFILRFLVREHAASGAEGFRPTTDEDLLSALSFRESGMFDLESARQVREEIATFYRAQGYMFVDVVLDYYERPQLQTMGGADLDVGGLIVYRTTLNRRAELRKVIIRGVQGMDLNRVRAVMETRPYDFFGGPGVILPRTVFGDLERIRELYLRNGYPKVRFKWTEGEHGVSVTRQGKDIVHTFRGPRGAFRVRTRKGTVDTYLEIGLEEGPRWSIGGVHFEGCKRIPCSEVGATAALEAGQGFSRNVVQQALFRVERLYKDQGFVDTIVRARCSGMKGGKEWDCLKEAPRSRDVEVTFSIHEGARAKVRGLLFDGKGRTKPYILERDLPKAGEPFSQERLARGLRTLKDLGIFSTVQVHPLRVPGSPPAVVLLVRYREATSRYLEVSVGFQSLNRSGDFPPEISSGIATSVSVHDIAGSGYGRNTDLTIPDVLVLAEVKYTDLNLLGTAKRLYVPVKYGFSATAWDRYASLTPTILDPRFFVRGLRFRFTPFVEYDRATTSLDVFQFGAELAVSKELLPRLFGSLSYSAAMVKSRRPGEQAAYSPFRLENKLMPVLTYDRLDHPTNPRKGAWFQTVLSYINTYSDQVRNYLKLETSAKAFVSLKNWVTLGLLLRYGTSRSFYGAGKLPEDERFTLGGNRGVRGFSTDGISQYTPDGGLRLEKNPDGTFSKVYGGDILVAGSAELRFPLLPPLDLYGACFYDFGALAERVSELSWKSFRHSAGFGVRLLIGGVIPLRLDYGLILDRRCKEVDPKTGACVLKEEVGNIHFGFLYTF